MKLYKIEKLIPLKENNFAKISKSIPTKSGVYLLFDLELELIYIGKAKNIRQRILQHTTENMNNRLSLEDKGTYWEHNYVACIPVNSASYYSYILEDDEKKRSLIESMLLLIIKTRFNNCDKIEALENYSKDKQNQEADKGEEAQKI